MSAPDLGSDLGRGRAAVRAHRGQATDTLSDLPRAIALQYQDVPPAALARMNLFQIEYNRRMRDLVDRVLLFDAHPRLAVMHYGRTVPEAPGC